jgi:hypothetical protein
MATPCEHVSPATRRRRPERPLRRRAGLRTALASSGHAPSRAAPHRQARAATAAAAIDSLARTSPVLRQTTRGRCAAGRPRLSQPAGRQRIVPSGRSAAPRRALLRRGGPALGARVFTTKPLRQPFSLAVGGTPRHGVALAPHGETHPPLPKKALPIPRAANAPARPARRHRPGLRCPKRRWRRFSAPRCFQRPAAPDPALKRPWPAASTCPAGAGG